MRFKKIKKGSEGLWLQSVILLDRVDWGPASSASISSQHVFARGEREDDLKVTGSNIVRGLETNELRLRVSNADKKNVSRAHVARQMSKAALATVRVISGIASGQQLNF